LIVRFDKPIAGDPKVLLKPLGRYLKGLTLSPDRKMATFPLAVPVAVKSFQTGNSVVVDLTETKAPTVSSAPPPVPATPTPVAPTPPAAKGAPAPAPLLPTPPPAEPVGPPTDLMVRGGEHTGFNRLVFDWPKPVGYTVDLSGGQAVLSFDRPANLNVVSLKAALPPDVSFVETRPAGKGTAVVLALPPEMRLRHFTSGTKVAVDLVRPAGAPPPPRANGAPPPPLAPAPGTDEQPPALKPLAAEPKPTPPAASLANKPDDAPAAEAPKAKGKVVSIGFPFNQAVGAAVFRRAGYLWAVFDKKAELDTKLLKRSGGDVITFLEQLNTPKGTAVRMLTRPGYNPSIRKEGQLWVLDLSEQPLAPTAGLEVNQQFDFEDRGRVVMIGSEPSAAMTIHDPEVGDDLLVVGLPTIGAGVRYGRIFPEAELLPTAQGVVAVPMADGVRLDTKRNNIELTMAGGIHMSPDVPATEGGAPPNTAAQVSATGPLDISTWMRGGPDKFYEEHEKLLRRLALVRPEDRNIQRLEIARHYLANGFGAEALGVLRTVAAVDPNMVEQPAYRAVHGAANFLMGRDAEAVEDLSLPALKNDPTVALFVAAARARSEPEPARQALALRLAADDIKGWPRNLRMSIGTIAAKSAAAAGDGKAVGKIVDAMNGPDRSRRDAGTLAYLSGLGLETQKLVDAAIGKYREAEDGESRPDRAYAARNRIELMVKTGRLSPNDAIRELERLRFAWRGEDFEYQLLKRLGEMQIAAKRYGEGLRTLHALVSNYGDNPDIANVSREMSEAFERLYLDGEADKLPAVTAIGLYDEFQELTPTGAKGDEMIRRLADRLAQVDLLDRAAELLRHQVTFRLSGLDKARIGARLALLEISDRKPQHALESLDLSEVPDIPADLATQRRMLRVQALDDQGRSAEALALIINDQSDEARRLRAEIYWRLKKWPEAAAALESLVDKPMPTKPLDPKSARRVLDLATALTLAKDDRGLQRIRRVWGAHMAATDFREAFELLTSETERGIIDYRRVGDKIKQVQDFQTFINEWQKRVRTQGLSSIN
ncbi:MAG: tetratricopeptide repeat protein, partial [Actinomycetota bacterium]